MLKRKKITVVALAVTLLCASALSYLAPTASAFEQKKWFVPDHGMWAVNQDWIGWDMTWDTTPCSQSYEMLDFEIKTPINSFEYDDGTIYSNLPEWQPNISQPDEQDSQMNDISVECTRPDLIEPGELYYIRIPIDALGQFSGSIVYVEVEHNTFYYIGTRTYEQFNAHIRTSSPYGIEGRFEQVFDQSSPANIENHAYSYFYLDDMALGFDYSTLTLTAYNADPTWARTVDVTINGHTTTPITWINPGDTVSAYVTIPTSWVNVGGYNTINAWVTGYQQYDNGQSWVTLTLKTSTPEHSQSISGTWEYWRQVEDSSNAVINLPNATDTILR